METDWNLALEIFISGIIGVFIVMTLLQLSTQASSKVVMLIEKQGEKKKQTDEANK